MPNPFTDVKYYVHPIAIMLQLETLYNLLCTVEESIRNTPIFSASIGMELKHSHPVHSNTNAERKNRSLSETSVTSTTSARRFITYALIRTPTAVALTVGKGRISCNCSGKRKHAKSIFLSNLRTGSQ